MRKPFLRNLLLAAVTASAFTPLAADAAGIPVLDASNLVQSTISALESVKQTAQQVEQYALQVKQYEDMDGIMNLN